MSPQVDADHATDAQLQSELLRPAYKFKGEPLWPWSRSAEHIYDMIRHPNDINVFRWLLLVWILKRRGGATAEEDIGSILPLCYHGQDLVRGEIIFSRDKLTDADEAEAGAIYDAIFKIAEASRVVVAPEPGQKKTEPTPQVIGDGSSTSSPSADGAEEMSSSIGGS
jgi:hypothetical protein